MSQGSQSIVDGIREWIATAVGWDPTRWLPADEQTRLSWAKPVKSLAEVPAVYQKFFDGLRPDEKEPFPYAVLTPTYKGFLTPENEKMICRIGGSLHVLEQIENRLVAIEYPFENISYIESGTILLSSWLTINGMNARGIPAASTLTFNSVTEHLFTPIVDGFRSAVTGAAEKAEPDIETPQFESLKDANFKFMNYARRTILPGEKVVLTILQPELRRKFIRWFEMPFSRQIAPAHLTILTESELVLIRDDESQRWLKEHPYGGIWRYIPLKQISTVSLYNREDELMTLSIRLQKNQQCESLFHESKKKEFQALQEQIKQRSIH